MRISKLATLLCFVVAFAAPLTGLLAQTGVLDPNDPVVDYNKNKPPTTPASTVMTKWVRTKHVSWNTDAFKSYYYGGIVFRLRFPNTYQHNVNDGKTYPLYVFFHGRGEKGTIYDNEFQLYHGGDLHEAAVNRGDFEGFLLYPQIQDDTWGTGDIAIVQKIITSYLVPELKIDPYRIVVDGLSAGGSAVWSFLITYPKLVASATPISASSTGYASTANIDKYKYTPVWHFQGELDQSPTKSLSIQVGNAILARGGNYKYTEYEGKGHGVWYNAWAEPDYYSFLSRANKTNPWPLFGRTEFCPGDAINVTLGVTAGFEAYEWKKDDGDAIAGATGNTLQATEVGKYYCRIKNGGVWSYWSPIPVEIKTKQPTITPPIQITGLASRLIPAPDGSTAVPLEEPEGYKTYLWQKQNDGSVSANTRQFNAASPGFYQATVTEQFGCSTVPSELFEVINANGPNPPDAPTNVVATETGKTSIQLQWDQNAAPAFNETGFEIYQSESASSGYKLLAITDADASTYSAENLKSGVPYFYIIRAINNTAASPVSAEVSATTEPDITAPTPPGNLVTGEITRTSVELTWNPSSDDVSVTGYDVFVNGVKSFTTTDTTFTVFNLIYGKSYDFYVRAKDPTGNISQPSNSVSSVTSLTGLIYKYYQGTWNNLPNFKKLTPVETGVTPNITIEAKSEEEGFAMYWEGTIRIPVAGTYTFRTISNDGSRLYINTPYAYKAVPLVDNDGTHSEKTKDGAITLQAGSYPIVATYFQKVTGATMEVWWQTPETGGVFTPIPDSAFGDDVSLKAPSPLVADMISDAKIKLTWTDKNDNETGYELWRAKTETGRYSLFKSLGANVLNFTTKRLAGDGSVFFFKVRAKSNNFYSPFTNVAGVSTFVSNYNIKLNINDGSVDGGSQFVPWNNTNGLPATGFTISNLLNDSNKYTGVKLTLIKNGFDASNNGGAVTGTNTGVFPDNVMKSSWFLNRLDTSKFKLSNLNQNMIYDFTFFGSRGGITDDRISGYRINSQTVTLNAKNNTTNTVSITGIRPDSNGNIFFTMFPVGNSDFAYINALLIKATIDSSLLRTIPASAVIAKTLSAEDAKPNLVAYPNPFINNITVKMLLDKNVHVLNATLLDASGKILFTRNFADVPKGLWQQTLQVNSNLQHGVYFLRVTGGAGIKAQTIKLLK